MSTYLSVPEPLIASDAVAATMYPWRTFLSKYVSSNNVHLSQTMPFHSSVAITSGFLTCFSVHCLESGIFPCSPSGQLLYRLWWKLKFLPNKLMFYCECPRDYLPVLYIYTDITNFFIKRMSSVKHGRLWFPFTSRIQWSACLVFLEFSMHYTYQTSLVVFSLLYVTNTLIRNIAMWPLLTLIRSTAMWPLLVKCIWPFECYKS